MSAAPPFRAEHIGSLLRPPELLQKRRRYEAGEASAAELKAVEDSCIEQAVRLQERVGLESITDGEYRRLIYFGHFPAAVSGFTDMEAELEFTEYGMVEAHCRLDLGPITVVPYTLLPPVEPSLS